jgi:hypothetical protein
MPRFLLCLVALAASDAALAKDFVIHAGTLIDGGDPLRDTGQFEKVSFVMKGGMVYRIHGAATATMSE